MSLPKLRESLGLSPLLLLILVPGLSALLYTTVNVLSLQRQAAEQDLRARVRAMSQLVDAELLRPQHALELVAVTSPPEPGRPLAEYQAILVQARQAMPYVDGLELLDRHGNTLVSADGVGPTKNGSSLGRGAAAFQGAFAGVGPATFGERTKHWQVGVAVPIRRDGEVAYVLNAVISCAKLTQLLSQQEMPSGAILALFDQQGTVAARTRTPELMVGKSVTPTVRDWLTHGAQDAVGQGKSMEGIHQVVAMHRSPTTGYGVVAGVPREVVEAAARKTLLVNAFTLGASLFIGLYLTFRYGNRLQKGLKRLELATMAVAKGDMHVLLPASPLPELRSLSTNFQEMVHSLRTYKHSLEHSVSHDHLTGLGNRVLLVRHLDAELARALRGDTVTAVLALDLDRFAAVNDSLTYKVGDDVLVALADRLVRTVRPSDFVARVGGDEFIVVASDLSGEAEAASLAFRLLRAVEEPLLIQGQTLTLTASIGVTVGPRDGEDSETLLMQAEGAMYRAKAGGANQFQFFAADVSRQVQGRLTLESGLRKAIDAGQLVLYYQPRINLSTGAIVGAEALLRWRDPARGLIPPGDFIPVAEASGLIAPIGRWVIERACSDAKKFVDLGLPLVIGVNVSVRQFQYGDLVNVIRAALRKSGIPPELLELEMTESAVMIDPSRTLAVLRELKGLGVRVALDDFGTGYSSLAHLKQMPVDVLKIDQSFIRGLSEGPEGAVLVNTILTLGHNLQQEVVAEGVETETQADFLKKNRCDLAQGYLYSKPLPLAEFIELLKKNSREQRPTLGMAKRFG